MGSIKEKIKGKLNKKEPNAEPFETEQFNAEQFNAEEAGKTSGFVRAVKKHLMGMIAIAVILAGAGTVYGALSSQVVDYGENPVYGESDGKTQVLIEGEGYALDKDQKKDYDLPQKIKKQKNNTINKYNPSAPVINPNYPRTSGSTYSGTGRTNYSTTAYAPTITTDLAKKSKKTYAVDKELEFYVEGKTYSRASIKTKYYSVKMKTGSKSKKWTKVALVEDDSTDTHGVYKIKVPKGKTTIRITVKDPLRKKTSTRAFIIKSKGSSPTEVAETTTTKEEETTTKPSSEPTEEKTYTVTAILEIDGIGAKYGSTASGGNGTTITVDLKEGAGSSDISSAINSEFSNAGYTVSDTGLNLPESDAVKYEEKTGTTHIVDDVDEEGNEISGHDEDVYKTQTVKSLSGNLTKSGIPSSGLASDITVLYKFKVN